MDAQDTQDLDGARYAGPTTITTVNREGHKVYRLADDVAFCARIKEREIIQRDPMVAALFGQAPIRAKSKVPKNS
ncbi:hypothetical protein GJ698_15285 [Pseudoduganella sp. FT26W]|uniref:Uncharacterized protein n=1 Tax=Duganella aquatilis TaxID=2666082 RepID=A0A844CXC3_9BURK|nr:hypothetical protein [Duganella aquatilis]MRW85447.1 hypothetical protein [Duganella aquatilis]